MRTQPNWSGRETVFVDSSASIDPALTLGLARASSELYAYQFSSSTCVAVVDSWRVRIDWPAGAATVAEGRFLNEFGASYLLPIVRFTQGVSRLQGSDFVADAFGTGTGTVVTIVPDASPAAYASSGRLQQALGSIAAALRAGSGLTTGELRLPVGSLRIDLGVDAVPKKLQALLPYDEINANFKRLDQAGGTYVRTLSGNAHLVIDASGMALDAASAGLFTYSPRNVNGPGGGNGSGGAYNGGLSTGGGLLPRVSCANAPDLRSMFVAVLDAQQSLLSLTALTVPGGSPVSCL